jgi:asparagine synthase (glutamine-hydrolysing)
MSGWALARSDSPGALGRWSAAVGGVADGPAVEHSAGAWRMLVWRRQRGEFPASGTLHTPPTGGRLAWIGQALSDSGDVSASAIRTIASAPSDADLAAINGPFAAALVSADGAATIVTDRYRHYPVYTHRAPGVFAASTDIRALVPLLEPAGIDPDAFDLLLRSGELIDRQTLLRSVELLPPATVLTIDAHGARERRYWRLQHAADASASFNELAQRIGEQLRAAVRRIEAATPRLGITLSGGLDSRFILDLCDDPSSIPSFTWGEPGCRDIACAAAYARRVNSPHAVRYWQPARFPPLWPQGATLTAGSFGVESMYMLPYVGLLQTHADVILNGLAGDAFLGGNFLKLSWLRETNLASLAEASWRWRVTPDQDALVDRLTGRSRPGRDLWAASITARSTARPIDRLNDWLYENRVFRNTNSGTMLLRCGVESHAPFFDNHVADTLLTVPHEMKFKHRLYLAVLKRACPDAASVKWQRTAIPPAWGFTANTTSMALHRIARAGGKRIGFDPFPGLAVADPAAWLRGPWREPAHDILFSARARERALVLPAELQRSWDEHQQGANRTRQLGVLIAVEVFCREVLDRAPVPRPDAVGALAS